MSNGLNRAIYKNKLKMPSSRGKNNKNVTITPLDNHEAHPYHKIKLIGIGGVEMAEE